MPQAFFLNYQFKVLFLRMSKTKYIGPPKSGEKTTEKYHKMRVKKGGKKVTEENEMKPTCAFEAHILRVMVKKCNF